MIGDTLVIAAIAPEALHDSRGFHRAAANAIERIKVFAQEHGDDLP
jgi:hypothetical protein